MSLDKATIAHIAELARIGLDQPELDQLSDELSKILVWIEQLNTVDTSGVLPMTSVVGSTLYQRPDQVDDGDRQEAILANAPARAEGFFVVPKVVE